MMFDSIKAGVEHLMTNNKVAFDEKPKHLCNNLQVPMSIVTQYVKRS